MKHSFIVIIMLSFIWVTGCSNSIRNSKEESKVIPDTITKTASLTKTDTIATTVTTTDNTTGKVITMDKQMFIDKVFDYEKNPQTWVFKGDKPCIIDFYADWCRPCRMVAPIMEEFAEKYKGQINVYKIDTEKQKELAQTFGIRSIPSVLFCPANGQPQMTQGALPKDQFENIIINLLLKK